MATTSRLPYFLQIYGAAAWDALAGAGCQRLGQEQVTAAATAGDNRRECYYQHCYEEFSDTNALALTRAVAMAFQAHAGRLNDALLAYLGRKGKEPLDQGRVLCTLLEANDFGSFADRLRSHLSGIPYQWHATGDLSRYEFWYASLLHMCFRSIDVDLRVEDASSHGRVDMVVLTGGQVFVLEFKMAEGDSEADAVLDAAIAQMRARGYAEKYRDRGEPIHLIGVVCGREARNLLELRAEPA